MRRPDVFTLDYSHPLAQGLVFAGLGQGPGAYDSSALTPWRGDFIFEGTSPPPRYEELIRRKALRVWKNGTGNSSAIHSPSPFMIPAGSDFTVSFYIADFTYVHTGEFFRTGSTSRGALSVQYSARRTLFQLSGTNLYQADWADPVGAVVDTGHNAGPFHHSFVYRSGSSLDYYLNGNLVGSVVSGIPATPLLDFYWLFRGWNIDGGQKDALYADLCFHNRALSPAEIALLADRTDPMLGGLVKEHWPTVYFDLGGEPPGPGTGVNCQIKISSEWKPAVCDKLLIDNEWKNVQDAKILSSGSWKNLL